MVKGADPRVCVLVLLAFCCPVLTGCGSHDDGAVQKLDQSQSVVWEAKIFVKALDYIIRSSETERIDGAFKERGAIFHDESRKVDFGKHSEIMEKMAALSGEVKVLLKQKPPKLEEARPKVDEMMKLSAKLPGPKVWLEEIWAIKKL